MKAARVHGWGQEPRIEQLPTPVGGPGLALVQMRAATVGHIDRSVWSGGFLRHPPLPYVPGVEAAGVVIQSEHHAPGTRVWIRGCGLGVVRDGTWREVIEAPEEALGLLPDGVSFGLGAAFFSPCSSAWVALHEVGQLKAGEQVLVTGATGAVGTLACQLARLAGARVRAVVADSSQAARLPAGLETVSLEALTPEAGLLVDTVGGQGLAQALRGVAPGGRAVLVGYTAGLEVTIHLEELLQRDINLLPLNMQRRHASGKAAGPALLKMLASGELSLPVREFALDEAGAAMRWITERGHQGRAVLCAATDR